MCLIVLAWEASPKTRLAVAANRDEFFARRAAPAAWWKGAPDVLAGRDLGAGGTWLGVTRKGRFAALTNFRDGSASKKDGAPSRGALAADFLRGDATAADYVAAIQSGAGRYHGFNLLVSDGAELWSFSRSFATSAQSSDEPPRPCSRTSVPFDFFAAIAQNPTGRGVAQW